MCQLKSCLVLKDRVYCPNHDNHDQMLNELHIADTIYNAESSFVRVELSPPNMNLLIPFNEWRLNVDQDFLLDWWDKDYYEPLVREEVKKWVDEHFIYSGERKILEGTYYAFNDAKIVARNRSIIHAFNNAKIFSYDESSIAAHHNVIVKAKMRSLVRANDNCKVIACDDTSVDLYDNVQAEIYDRAQARAYNNSKVKAYDRSTVSCQNNVKIVCNHISRCFVYDADEVVCNDNSVIYLQNHASVTANNNSVIFKTKCNDSKIILNDNALITTLIT